MDELLEHERWRPFTQMKFACLPNMRCSVFPTSLLGPLHCNEVMNFKVAFLGSGKVLLI